MKGECGKVREARKVNREAQSWDDLGARSWDKHNTKLLNRQWMRISPPNTLVSKDIEEYQKNFIYGFNVNSTLTIN